MGSREGGIVGEWNGRYMVGTFGVEEHGMLRRVALYSIAAMAVVLWSRRMSVSGEGGGKVVKLGTVNSELRC